MKNVVVNKMVRYVFTEQQLRGAWKQAGEDLTYESLTPQQLMEFAIRVMENTSHSGMEQHILGRGWRTEDDVDGKMIAEDDTRPDVHIELIDTDQQGEGARILLDRVLKVACLPCDFSFYVDNVDQDVSQLKCPQCQGTVKEVKVNKIIRRTYQ